MTRAHFMRNCSLSLISWLQPIFVGNKCMYIFYRECNSSSTNPKAPFLSLFIFLSIVLPLFLGYVCFYKECNSSSANPKAPFLSLFNFLSISLSLFLSFPLQEWERRRNRLGVKAKLVEQVSFSCPSWSRKFTGVGQIKHEIAEFRG